MISKNFVLLALGGLAAVGVWKFAPSVQTAMDTQLDRYFGWTEEARQANPVEFVNHVSQTLGDDLEAMRTARRHLYAELALLGGKDREMRGNRQFALQQAEDFRAALQRAEFPVALCDGVYPSGESVTFQISQLLAEIDGYDQTLAEIEELNAEAKTKLSNLTVQINSTEAQITMTGVKRELLAARELTESGQQMLLAVNGLLNRNHRVVKENPVRSVEELLAAAKARPGSTVSDARMRAFLAQAADDEADESSCAVKEEQDTAKVENPESKVSPTIFQQYLSRL